jgi:hypothetical protein
MALVFSIADAAQALVVFAALRRLHDYPQPGVHVGNGVHVPQDGADETTPGWTRRHRRIWRRRSDGSFWYFCDAVHNALIADPTARARLTAGQRTLLDAKTSSATDDPTIGHPDERGSPGDYDEIDPT